MKRSTLESALEGGDHGRSGIDDEMVALPLARQSITENMRGGIAGDHADAIAAIGNPNGVEGIEALGYARPEQAPVLLVIPADIHVEDQGGTVVVTRRPAHRPRRPVPDRGEGGSGRVLGVA